MAMDPNDFEQSYDYNLEQDKVARRRKIADMLAAQGQERGGYTSNGYATIYTGPSGWARLGSGLASGLLNRSANKNEKENADFADKRLAARLLQLENLNKPTNSGEPAPVTDLPPDPNNPDAPTQEITVTANKWKDPRGIYTSMLREGPMAARTAATALTPSTWDFKQGGSGDYMVSDRGEITKVGNPNKAPHFESTDKGLMKWDDFEQKLKPVVSEDGDPVLSETAAKQAAANAKEQAQADSGFENSNSMLQNAINGLAQVLEGDTVEKTAGAGWDAMWRSIPGSEEYNTKFNVERSLAKNVMTGITALKASGVGTSAFNSDKEAERLEMALGKINWNSEKEARSQLNELFTDLKDTQKRLAKANTEMRAATMGKGSSAGGMREPNSGAGAKLDISMFD